MTTGVKLLAEPVVLPSQVQTMREIRNSGRHGFLHDQHEISKTEQRAWWESNKDRVKAWLFYAVYGVVAYGALRQTEDGRWWSTCAVLPAHGGNGYGTQVMRFLTANAGGPVWAEVAKFNVASFKMHKPDEWRVVEEDDERWLLTTEGIRG